MKLDAQHLQTLREVLKHTHGVELTCDEWLAELPAYLEADTVAQASERFRLVREHLDLCPECREELALILAAIADNSDDADTAAK